MESRRDNGHGGCHNSAMHSNGTARRRTKPNKTRVDHGKQDDYPKWDNQECPPTCITFGKIISLITRANQTPITPITLLCRKQRHETLKYLIKNQNKTFKKKRRKKLRVT